MNAIKVDIIKTPIALEKTQEYYLFYRVNDKLISPEDMSSEIVLNVIAERYKLTSFHNHGSNKIEHYLIKADDNGLLNNFIQVENNILNEYLETAMREGKHRGYIDGRASIKKLSFWKRLFNQY